MASWAAALPRPHISLRTAPLRTPVLMDRYQLVCISEFKIPMNMSPLSHLACYFGEVKARGAPHLLLLLPGDTVPALPPTTIFSPLT